MSSPAVKPNLEHLSPPSNVTHYWFEDAQVEHEEWLIENLVPQRSYTGIFGRHGAAKTFFALDMACSGALGRPFLGEAVERFGSVYCCGEKQSRFGKRIEAWRLAHGETRVPVLVRRGVPNLLSDAEVSAFIAWLLEVRPDFERRRVRLGAVFFDTLSRSLRGANVSDPDATGIALNSIQRIITEAQVTVLTLAHVAKSVGSDTTKGAGEWGDAADALIRIDRKDDDNLRTVTLAKQSDAQDGHSYGFELEVVEIGTAPNGQRMTSCIIREVDLPEAPKRDKTNPRQTMVLAAIRHCIEAGQCEPAPPVPGVPAGTKAVRRNVLKGRLLDAGYSDEDEKPDTVKRNINRDLQALIASKRVRGEGDFVWPV